MDEKLIKKALIIAFFYIGLICVCVGAFKYDTIVGWSVTGFMLITLAITAHTKEEGE
jgi:hypothetical protein